MAGLFLEMVLMARRMILRDPIQILEGRRAMRAGRQPDDRSLIICIKKNIFMILIKSTSFNNYVLIYWIRRALRAAGGADLARASDPLIYLKLCENMSYENRWRACALLTSLSSGPV